MIIYSILINNNGSWQYLYKPGTSAAVTGAKLNLALNDAGSLEFTVPPTNALQDMLFERSTKVQVQKNDNEYWYGYILDITENSRKEKKVYCVGELSYLNDTIQPQAKYQHQTPLQLFTAYLAEHNAQSDEQFLVGQVTVTDPNDDVYRYTNLESTLTALRDDLCASLQGYLRIRRADGYRYLDLVKITDYGPQNTQTIQFGYNLLDYACNTTASDIATACRPKGARLETQAIEGLDSYVDITSVNDGVDYVEDDTAVANFGMIKKVVSWDNVTDPQTLKDKAEAWLSENQFAKMTLNVSAIDMAALVTMAGTWKQYDQVTWNELLNKTWRQLALGQQPIQSFELGDRVHAIADPYGMHAWFPIQSVSIDLQDYTKTVYSLSNVSQKTYTQQQATASNALKQELNEASSFLNQYVRNQTSIINNTEGYFTIQKNDHAMTGWTIADNESPELADNLVVATLGGIGISEDGGEHYKTAITGAGINADTVTSGTMVADRIKGGTLTLGGLNNTNGTLTMKDASNNTIGGWNKDGIEITKGKIHLQAQNAQDFDKFKITSANDNWKVEMSPGYLEASGTVSGSQYISQYSIAGLTVNKGNIMSAIAADEGFINEGGSTGRVVFNITGNGRAQGGSWLNGSLAEYKTNIEPCEDMLDLVNDTEIYRYNFKGEFEQGIDNKSYGVVIGEEYKHTPEEILGAERDSVDTYSMISVLWKAVQELSAKVDDLESKLEGVSDK